MNTEDPRATPARLCTSASSSRCCGLESARPTRSAKASRPWTRRATAGKFYRFENAAVAPWREAGHTGQPSVDLRIPVYVYAGLTETGALEQPRESITAVFRRLAGLREELGLGGSVVEPNPAGLSPTQYAARSLRIVARDIMPAFK